MGLIAVRDRLEFVRSLIGFGRDLKRAGEDEGEWEMWE
jgi:hypothetical protein